MPAPEVEVDVLRRDEGGVEAAEAVEERLRVGEVGARPRRVLPPVRKLDAVQLREGPVPHEDGAPRHDAVGDTAPGLDELLRPERVGDAVPVREGQERPGGGGGADVAPLAAAAGPLDDLESGQAPRVHARHLGRAVGAHGVDHDDFAQVALRDEGVEEVAQVGRLVAHGDDDADRLVGAQVHGRAKDGGEKRLIEQGLHGSCRIPGILSVRLTPSLQSGRNPWNG
jgi:hypothetical protein